MTGFDDRVVVRQQLLLDALQDRFDAAGVPVCRAFLAPGRTAVWDVCCPCGDGEGQAWVAVPEMFPTDPFPMQDAGPQRCHPREYAVELVVGVLRCAHVVDDHGTPPTAVQMTADALKVARDRKIVRDALLCGLADEPGTFTLGRWAALGPQGACVGGEWRATMAVPACPCDPLDGE